MIKITGTIDWIYPALHKSHQDAAMLYRAAFIEITYEPTIVRLEFVFSGEKYICHLKSFDKNIFNGVGTCEGEETIKITTATLYKSDKSWLIKGDWKQTASLEEEETTFIVEWLLIQ